MGSSSDWLEHIANIHCPFFKSISVMLNDNSFGLHDTSHLEAKLSRERFLTDLEEGKQIDTNQDFKYYFSTQHEKMTRDMDGHNTFTQNQPFKTISGVQILSYHL
jgi:hypothetical protein